jgi:hypothetical protein
MLSILNSFERRLATLETSMVPIHQKTLGLTVASRSASHFSPTSHSALCIQDSEFCIGGSLLIHFPLQNIFCS